VTYNNRLLKDKK